MEMTKELLVWIIMGILIITALMETVKRYTSRTWIYAPTAAAASGIISFLYEQAGIYEGNLSMMIVIASLLYAFQHLFGDVAIKRMRKKIVQMKVRL